MLQQILDLGTIFLQGSRFRSQMHSFMNEIIISFPSVHGGFFFQRAGISSRTPFRDGHLGTIRYYLGMKWLVGKISGTKRVTEIHP